jgi:hypothetical protein
MNANELSPDIEAERPGWLVRIFYRGLNGEIYLSHMVFCKNKKEVRRVRETRKPFDVMRVEMASGVLVERVRVFTADKFLKW